MEQAKCYAIGTTRDGEELHCCLPRAHRGHSFHYDSVRELYWNVDLLASAWALVML